VPRRPRSGVHVTAIHLRAKRASASGTQARYEPRISVVVVDDDRDLREMLRELLESHGMTARAYASIEAARTAIAESRPDAVLTDLALGAEHGRDLARTLRDDPATEAIPVIAISGEVEPTLDVVRYFDAYLRKPLDLGLVPDLVRAVVATRRGGAPSSDEASG
jgi:CheY-like chemotaxis protein